MAKATVNKPEQNLDSITSQLLDNPKFGSKLLQGGSVPYEALDMTTRRQLGLQQGDSINIARDVLNQITGRVPQNSTVQPFSSLKDVVEGVKKTTTPKVIPNIKPNVIQTNETINTTAGKGVKKQIGQRNLQEIAVRDNTKSLLDNLKEILGTIQQNIPLTNPAMAQGAAIGQNIGNDLEVAAQSGQENLLRLLSNLVNRPTTRTPEQDVFSAIRSQVGLRPKEAGGSVVQVGNKRYRIDASGRITQVLEPTV